MALTGLTKIQKVGISTTTIPTLGGSENTGVVTATTFVGDGSGLSNVTGSGSGVIVRDGGSLVGTAGTINFGTNLNVSAISAGIVTVTNAVSASALTNLSDVTISSPSNGQVLKYNGSAFVNAADTNTTYSQSSVASGSNVNLRLSDGSTDDDILITAGSNITFSSVSAGGFTIAASGGGGGGGLSNVVEDTTPQLGGSLDLNNKFITGSGGINVSGVTTSTSFVGALTGNVTGNADTATTTERVTLTNQGGDSTCNVLFAQSATGNQLPHTNANLTFNATNGRLTATSFAGSGVALTGIVTSIVAGSNITLTGGPTGIVTIAAAGGGSGITDVIQDTTPQLGGNLDLNSKYITGSGGINVTGVITATTFVGNGDFVDLDVDGHTELDNVNIAGVSTFASNLTISGDASNNSFITESGSGNLFIKADDAIFNNAAGSTFLGSFTSAGLTTPNILLSGEITHSGDTNTAFGFPANDQFKVQTAGFARMEVIGDYIYLNGQQTGNNRALLYNYATGLGFYGSVSSSASDQRNIIFNTNGNTTKLEVNSSGVNVTGICSATSFKKDSGTSSQFLKADGSVDSNTYLTSGSYIENVVEDTTPQLGGNLDLNSKNITGTGNAQIVGVITATSAVKTWTLGASGSSHYTFTGDGFTSATNDPDIYLERGKRYAFLNNSGGSHPFQIRVASGGSAYSTGVTNNGASSGYITFNVPWDAPATLVYQCTSHSGMLGNIYIRGASGGNENVGVTTFTGTIHANETGDAKGIRIHSNGGISATNNELRFNTSQSSGFTFMANSDGSSSNERFRITGAGKVLIGHSSPTSVGVGAAYNMPLQVIGNSYDTAGIVAARYAADANGPTMHFVKSRNATKGSQTIVQVDDTLGFIRWYGSDGTDTTNAAAMIGGYCDATPASDKIPGRLSFWTTDTLTYPRERLRITSGGQVNIGDDFTQTTYKTQIEATNGNVLRLVTDSDDANGVELVLRKDSASPADQDNIGNIYFQGNDDSGAATFYASMEAYSSDVSNTSENGYIRFRTRNDGTMAERLRIASDGDVTMNTSATANFFTGAALNIVSDKNAETDLDDKANYHLVLANPNNDTNESIGLAFGITDTGSKVGAAILHERDAAGSQGSLRFFTRPNNAGPPTEKVRIPATTWGLLVTNLSSTGSTGGYQTEGVSLRYDGDSTFVRTGSAAVTMTRKGTAGRALDFYHGTTFAGGIYVNGSASVAFNTSDYRLKTDVNSITDGIDKVKQLNPVYYKWKDTGDTVNTQNGFLAHEVQSVIPTLVFGEKDATIDERGQGYQGVNYAGFTPTAIAAIKELIAKVETLEAKVAALEGS